MKKPTKEWVRKAENDYRLALKIACGKEPFPDHQCFACQQSAEKYLKAIQEELGQSAPKTHDLDKLLNLLQPTYPSLRSLRRGLLFLSNFAVDPRYPGNWASKRQAVAALRWAGRVRDDCRSILGIPKSRRRPRKKS